MCTTWNCSLIIENERLQVVGTKYLTYRFYFSHLGSSQVHNLKIDVIFFFGNSKKNYQSLDNSELLNCNIYIFNENLDHSSKL
jgi:hypothetical protein